MKERLSDSKERLSDSNANRHSNMNTHKERYNQDIDPNGIEVNNINDNNKEECSKNAVFYSTDLRGGRNSGLFTRIGQVDDIKECTQHCCATPRCDLAYMDKSICYTVICHFPSLCQPVRSIRTHTTIGYVTRNSQTVYDPRKYYLAFAASIIMLPFRTTW